MDKMTGSEARDGLLLRQGVEADAPIISALLAENGMDELDDPVDSCLVAEVDGLTVGFAHIEVANGRAWIRPVIVDSGCSGAGIGSALVRNLLAEYGALSVVARGSAVAFYERMGFVPLSWDAVPDVHRHECDEMCDWREECGPTPMEYVDGSGGPTRG
jgi:N-acetylglutamate synthase-like GNAT family acetyltransferase